MLRFHQTACLLLLAAVVFGVSGCQQRAPAEFTEPWTYADHGAVIVTLRRWAGVGLDDRDQVYYVNFIAEDLVNDDNIIIIRDLEHLKYLDLRGTLVTDYGMESLRGLRSLKILKLPDGLTDAGLEHLRRLKSLRRIDISEESKITSVGVERLQKSLPFTKINFRDVFEL